MTATASPSTRTRIEGMLKMTAPTRVIASPDRKELFVELRKHHAKDDDFAYGHVKDQLLEKGVHCERHIIYVQVSFILKMLNIATATYN